MAEDTWVQGEKVGPGRFAKHGDHTSEGSIVVQGIPKCSVVCRFWWRRGICIG